MSSLTKNEQSSKFFKSQHTNLTNITVIIITISVENQER